jgi:hypothetical protein
MSVCGGSHMVVVVAAAAEVHGNPSMTVGLLKTLCGTAGQEDSSYGS